MLHSFSHNQRDDVECLRVIGSVLHSFFFDSSVGADGGLSVLDLQ